MNAIAALAAKEAAVVSGLGAGLLAPSAVDGFAAGTLLSGICVLMVVGPGRRLRRARPGPEVVAARGGWGTTAYAAPAGYPVAAMSDPYADESAEALVPPAATLPSALPMPSPSPAASPGRDEAGHGHDGKSGGYRSKHRLSEPEAGDRRPESRRSAPRHAAPSHGIGSRMVGRLPLHPLTVRD